MCGGFLEHCRLALIEEPDLVKQLKFKRLFEKAAGRFVKRFVAKAESSKMHRNHHLGPKLAKRLQGLLGIHVNVALSGRLISADGEQGEFDVGALADLLEAFKVGGVAAVKYRASRVFDEKAAESSVAIVKDSCSPVSCRGEGDLEGAVLEALPGPQLVDAIESQVMNEIADVLGHGDGLIAGYGAQRAAVEMVEMRVGYKNEIDGREITELDPRMLDALDDLEPLCPVGIYEHAVLGGLDEEGCVSDPRHAELSGREFGEDRLEPVPVASGKERGDNNLGKKISPVPPIAEPHVDMILRLCALSCS